jgi:hypothetical protein
VTALKYPVVPGSVYGRLTVIREERIRVLTKRTRYARGVLCQCTCGTQRVFHWHNVRNGFSKSCGCLMTEYVESRKPTPEQISGMQNDFANGHNVAGIADRYGFSQNTVRVYLRRMRGDQ